MPRSIAVGRRTTNELKTFGNFNGTNQYLSVASNSTLQTGDVDWWASVWFLTNVISADKTMFSKWGGTQNERGLDLASTNNVTMYIVSGSTITTLAAVAFGPITVGVWRHAFQWFDSVANTIGISVNGVSNTASYTSVPNSSNSPVEIGSYANGTGQFWNGKLSEVAFGKSPAGGFATTPAATIAAALYNSGRGLRHSKITPAQVTAWGVVSGWLDGGSLTADSFGSNTLTNNNTVTQSYGWFQGQ